MEKSDGLTGAGLPNPWLAGYRLRYEEQVAATRAVFEGHAQHLHAGGAAIEARSAAVDALIQAVWAEVQPGEANLANGVALVGVGGYGRRELFPYSDVDLMFLLDARVSERAVKEPIRRLNQLLWDSGLRVSAMTRTLNECERFDAENVEFTLALLDARWVAGDRGLTGRLLEKTVPKLMGRDAKKIAMRLLDVTRTRHAKYGDTLFHLEPNIKECPGGLRDAHVCAWLARLGKVQVSGEHEDERDDGREFREAHDFLLSVRTFLHLRHERDDNMLDWQAQDAAALVSLGAGRVGAGHAGAGASVDAAYWMRVYFRHARAVAREMAKHLDEAPAVRLAQPLGLPQSDPARPGVEVRKQRIWFTGAEAEQEPESVLAVFSAMAQSGAGPAPETERRIEQALPVLSAHLEDGPILWRLLQAILLGSFAGAALRSMHALGILELVIPEFHGIDALVIRDAYHRYTVDEHTFVLIDTLHALRAAGKLKPRGGLEVWAARFEGLFRDLPHPELLFVAALLHDTGKGRATQEHAEESTRMAANVLQRLEVDGYESALVLDLIRQHLEMSAALRRDVFDQETIRSFGARVQSPEALRMLTLFTYADIAAVHPDALTPWKAENLWRLYNATAAYLDRHVDEERVAADASSALRELVYRIHALLPDAKTKVDEYLEGFPQRYLQTRTPETVRRHIELAWKLETDAESVELDFRYGAGLSELTLVTNDRPMLFATMAGALAGWGMNIITADAFSNAHGIVVDSFRFADSYRTLELNESERVRFVESVRDVMSGRGDLEALLGSRRRGRKRAAKTKVQTRIDFDDSASSQSTLTQVVAQDTPGLLRALSTTMAGHGCNIEVALVDTEGETAIDVFYLTRAGGKLTGAQHESLRSALLEAIERNAE